jgi:hypothetical protein
MLLVVLTPDTTAIFIALFLVCEAGTVPIVVKSCFSKRGYLQVHTLRLTAIAFLLVFSVYNLNICHLQISMSHISSCVRFLPGDPLESFQVLIGLKLANR